MTMRTDNTSLTVLCLYAESQTFTNSVYDHLSAFKYSQLNWHFADIFKLNDSAELLENYDVIVLHYSVRVAFQQVPAPIHRAITAHEGLKVLFIQDEYDNVATTWQEIIKLGFQLVFSCVPEESLSLVYPKHQFADVTFVSVLTGYVPTIDQYTPNPLSQRKIVIGYRGRLLPIRYGQLSREKYQIGAKTREFCRLRDIPHDIKWNESSRLYGDSWLKFLSSCRSMLGTESGSNVFDFDCNLWSEIKDFQLANPLATDDSLYAGVIAHREMHGMMNQISPRIFEMISHGTLCVLYPGKYSGILKPYIHYIPLAKDHSNIEQVVDLIMEDSLVYQITRTAYDDIVGSGRFSYSNFVASVDENIRRSYLSIQPINQHSRIGLSNHPQITSAPIYSALATVCPKATSLLKRVVTAGPLGKIIEWWQN